jgi:hypothetical protein
MWWEYRSKNNLSMPRTSETNLATEGGREKISGWVPLSRK